MRITAAMLREKNACAEQVKIFESEWPNGANVTLKNCRRAFELGLSLDWAVENLLSATAWATYQSAIAPARATYEAAIAPARATYQAARATAWATYDAAIAPAEAPYQAARATAFYRVAAGRGR